ncbi:MAG: hypothetical protein LBC97_14350 [Bifidobacteriaceae bacterium]|nr:hypothetical protein [Bifidobacteriaceae bacterium]
MSQQAPVPNPFSPPPPGHYLAADGRYYPGAASHHPAPPPLVPGPPAKKRTGLIVGIVVGALVLPFVILAAIAIPLFLSQRAKTADSDAQWDLQGIGKEVASEAVGLRDEGRGTIEFDQGTEGYILTVRSSTGEREIVVPRSEGVELQASSDFEGPRSWCVGVHAEGGKVKDFAITAAQTVVEGGLCDPGGGTAAKP